MFPVAGLINYVSCCWFDYVVSWFPGAGLITLFSGASLINLFTGFLV